MQLSKIEQVVFAIIAFFLLWTIAGFRWPFVEIGGAMVLQCYTWIVDFFKQIIIGNRDDNGSTAIDFCTYVPNEIAIDILSRLQVESVLQCRKVCKNWRKLTSSSQFIELHQRRAAPIILRRHGSYQDSWVSVIDEKSEEKCEVMGLGTFSLLGCCNGLVLMKPRYPSFDYFVINPLSKGGKITTIYSMISRGDPCGFFFHPLAKEYRILFACKNSGSCYEYHLYLFGAKMWRKTINPYFYCVPPRDATCCAIVNRALHWIHSRFVVWERTGENFCIIVFETNNEKFSMRPIPPVQSQSRGRGQTMRLLVKEDRLCFCHVASEEHVMSVWILEDYVNWCWIRKYNVNLDWDIKKFSMVRHYENYASNFSTVHIVTIHKDEIKLLWWKRGLFSYNLGHNTIKKFQLKKSKHEILCDHDFGYVACTKSLEVNMSGHCD
ncbi:hypothetical protein ACJIZ3_003915 [Penstemon smallii]|uniref:F-box domain-containing protein n=1 Tax=Penstemon smallii TaxID=265156 RepID=A0ABD3S0K5_9LAMI